jgi:hypothetical protein
MILVVHPGSGSRILILIFYPCKSRIQGSKRHQFPDPISRIQIRNTGDETERDQFCFYDFRQKKQQTARMSDAGTSTSGTRDGANHGSEQLGVYAVLDSLEEIAEKM